ncbi:MAG TPA: hypothetical protein VFE24_05520 [Pirellulales bacterium]|jgi:hypothetical protein|nr:hypothetical protein [Pirellulales bacterium]
MLKGFFLVSGLFTFLLGIEALLIDRAVLTGGGDLNPPEWAPWSLMSAGAVIILYSFTIPKRIAG